LRERADEIPAWARFMVQRRAEESGTPATLDEAAATLLQAAPWPGNLRQLDNVIRRAFMLARADRSQPLAVAAAHVEAALRYEGGPSPAGSVSAVGALERAAAQIVAAAAARRDQAGPLPFELCAGLTGFILAEAEAQLGSREEAMRLLGEETQVKNRNHNRAWRRELALSRQRFLAQGEAPPAGLREG
jgi:DNA-binding NtrC family response regulator